MRQIILYEEGFPCYFHGYATYGKIPTSHRSR